MTASICSDRYEVHADDVARFARDGHVMLRGVSEASELRPFDAAIRTAVERLTADQVPIAQRDTYGKAFLQVPNLWRHDPVVAAFVLAERFAGIAAQLLAASAVRIYHDQALFKEPGGGITPWHQDAMYWPLDGNRCVTMWMPLVDISPDMGQLTFASGSHRAGPLSDVHISDASQRHFDELLADGQFALSHGEPMSAGDASFHAGWTVHRADPNLSDRSRRVMTVIWFADGSIVREPTNAAQERDLATWLPGLTVGDRAASPLNPLVGH